jgi:predicted transcriptional regulator
VNPLPDHRPGQQHAAVRTDARFDETTRAKVDGPATRFHRPRAAVLSDIMQWGLSHGETLTPDQGEPQSPVHHLSLYVASDLHEQVQKAATAAEVKGTLWLRHMVRQITAADFPASWQEMTPRERSHDSRTYTIRFMLRLDDLSETKLQRLVTQFGTSKAAIIRQLIAQPELKDFPTSWQMRAVERRTHQPHSR